jgi:type III pantothenate kinase
MVFILDIGNTAIKIAVVDHLKVYDLTRCNVNNFPGYFNALALKYPAITQIVWCQVGIFPEPTKRALQKRYAFFEITTACKLPFENLYKSDSLGVDRMALIAGAQQFSKTGQGTLIVGIGTCITYDFIDAYNSYHGGAISPGIRLRYESLHNFTANLPLLTAEKQQSFVGDTTASAIHNGVLNGVLQEIKGTRKQYKTLDINLNCLITGGDAQILHPELKRRFFTTPFLMLHGIYNLYTFNK